MGTVEGLRQLQTVYFPLLRIRDVYPGSRIRLFSIPEPNCLHPGSALKNFSILTPKNQKKWFLSSRKYDPGCSSRTRIRMLTFYPSQIPDPGAKKAPDPGSGSATLVLFKEPSLVSTQLYRSPKLHRSGFIHTYLHGLSGILEFPLFSRKIVWSIWDRTVFVLPVAKQKSVIYFPLRLFC